MTCAEISGIGPARIHMAMSLQRGLLRIPLQMFELFICYYRRSLFTVSCFNFKKIHVTEVQENSLFILVCQFYFRKLATLFACTWPGGRSILNLIGVHFSVAGTTWRSGLIFLKTNVDWPKVRSFHKNFENGGVQFLPITWGRVWFMVNK